MVWCADEASANRRLYAQAEVKAQTMRSNVLLIFSPCLLHILHRSVVPTLKHNNCINELFRAANVLQVASYWTSLIRAVRAWLRKSVVVLHNDSSPQDRDQEVAEHILRLTLCKGLPDDMLSARDLDVKADMLSVFSGDWTSDVVRYRCRDPDCPGGAACKKKATDKMMRLLLETVFAKKVVIPSLNRWWRFTPVARQVLLGVAIHGVWAHGAPSRTAAAGPEQADGAEAGGADDTWHAVHKFRVRKTFEFLKRGDAAGSLILILQSLGPAHLIMAWIMGHMGAQPRQGTSKAQVLRDFAQPSTSPIWKALSMGSDLLRSESAWTALWAFHRGARSDAILPVWQAMLPSIAVIFSRARGFVESWPLKLLGLLSSDAAVQDAVAKEFCSLRQCCLPRGILALRAAVECPGDCKTSWFKSVVSEFASQVDVANFDQETNHASMRSMLGTGEGKSYAFPQAAMMHMGHELGKAHSAAVAAAAGMPKNKVGRPKASKTKRRRYDAWNAFVAENRPSATPGEGSQSIRSGDHLKRLSARWARMSSDEKQQYKDVAAAREAARWAADDGERDLEDPCLETRDVSTVCRSGWGIGDAKSPMTAEAMDSPKFSPELKADVDAWCESLGGPVKHVPGSLPYKDTVYHTPCLPGVCCSSEAFPKAAALAKSFFQLFPGVAVGSLFMIMGEGEAGLLSSCFMVAHRKDRPRACVFLEMALAERIAPLDLKIGSNLPWSMKFQRVTGAGPDAGHLDMVADVKFMFDFYCRCLALGLDDISIAELLHAPTSLCELRVDKMGQMKSLSNMDLNELAALASDDDEPSEHLLDMASLQEDGAPRRLQTQAVARRTPKQGQKKEGESESDDECGHEASVRSGAQFALCEWENDVAQSRLDVEMARLGDPDALSPLGQPEGLQESIPIVDANAAGGAASSSSSAAPEPGRAAGQALGHELTDWAQYDAYLRPDGGRCTNVVDASGRTVGQLQPLSAGAGYTVSALCFCSHHEKRCARMRTWKMDKEQPEMVERVLIRWLLQAGEYATTEDHKKARRH